MNTYQKIQETVQSLAGAVRTKPRLGIILGTGLGQLAQSIRQEAAISYTQIPHFPISTVESHAGQLIFGELSGKPVVAMQGRFHLYEGYTMEQIVFPVRVMRFLGIQALIVSNACGGLNPNFKRGELMVISDHINLLGQNPLVGHNDERIGPRFPDMSEPYSREFIRLAQKVARDLEIPLHQGVYACMSGPSLETAAEYRYLQHIGADVIGMSTVPEVIAAVHCGLQVLGISVITDLCRPDNLTPTHLEEIIQTAMKAEPQLVKILEKVVEQISIRKPGE